MDESVSSLRPFRLLLHDISYTEIRCAGASPGLVQAKAAVPACLVVVALVDPRGKGPWGAMEKPAAVGNMLPT